MHITDEQIYIFYDSIIPFAANGLTLKCVPGQWFFQAFHCKTIDWYWNTHQNMLTTC
jgi:hypothetical protein